MLETKAAALTALAALLVAAGCGTATTGPGYARSSGTLAISADSTRLFIADQDNGQLVVVDPAKESVVANIAVGRQPVRVVVAPDGRLFVANRGDRTVAVVDPVKLAVTAKIHVGAEPVGLAFSEDGRTLLVANNTSRTLSFVDVASLKPLHDLALAADPTGVTVVGGTAYVSFARSPKVGVVDVGARALDTGADVDLTLSKADAGGEARRADQAVTPVFDPGASRLYVAHVQSKTDLIPTQVGQNNAYVGNPGSIPAVANALATVDTGTNEVLRAPAPATSGCGDCTSDAAGGVPAVMRLTDGALAGPSAAVLDPSGNWLYVTNIASANVSVLAVGSGETDLAAVKVGHGPNGIALDASGKKAFVFNSFDHTVSVLEGRSGQVVVTHTFVVGSSSLTPQQELGRKLFYAADDTRMTNPSSGGVACASCHPGGREDGRTWQFSEGPRNTPTLAGRDLGQNQHFHWDGMIDGMPGFQKVVVDRMGGSGEGSGADPLTDSDFDAILAYLESLPAPDNPNRTASLTAPEQRGKALFEGEALCITCHSGPDHTDRTWHDVGTMGVAADGRPELFPMGGVVTPPLNNVFNTAPYLHNGTIQTLRDRLTNNPGDRHGMTSKLSPAQIDDLVAYLKTL